VYVLTLCVLFLIVIGMLVTRRVKIWCIKFSLCILSAEAALKLYTPADSQGMPRCFEAACVVQRRCTLGDVSEGRSRLPSAVAEANSQ